MSRRFHVGPRWPLLAGLAPILAAAAFVLPSRPAAPQGLVFSPDGNYLTAMCPNAFLGNDTSYRVWSTDTFREVPPLYPPIDATRSADGKLAAVPSPDGSVRLVDMATGRQRYCIAHPGSHPAACVVTAYSPDGQSLAAAWDSGLVTVWHWPSLHERSSFTLSMGGFDVALAFSPDEKTLAAAPGGWGTIQLWNAATGERRPDRPFPMFAGSKPPLEFSADGKTVLSANAWSGVSVWDVTTGDPIMSTPKRWGWAAPSAFSARAGLVAIAWPQLRRIHLCDAAGLRVRRELVAPGVRPSALAFSPDGRWLAAAFGDGTIRLWNAVTGQPTTTISTGRALAVAFYATMLALGLWSVAWLQAGKRQPWHPAVDVAVIALLSILTLSWRISTGVQAAADRPQPDLNDVTLHFPSLAVIPEPLGTCVGLLTFWAFWGLGGVLLVGAMLGTRRWSLRAAGVLAALGSFVAPYAVWKHAVAGLYPLSDAATVARTALLPAGIVPDIVTHELFGAGPGVFAALLVAMTVSRGLRTRIVRTSPLPQSSRPNQESSGAILLVDLVLLVAVVALLLTVLPDASPVGRLLQFLAAERGCLLVFEIAVVASVCGVVSVAAWCALGVARLRLRFEVMTAACLVVAALHRTFFGALGPERWFALLWPGLATVVAGVLLVFRWHGYRLAGRRDPT